MRCRPFVLEDKLAVKMAQVSHDKASVELLNSQYQRTKFSCNHVWWSAHNYKKFLQSGNEADADAMALVNQEDNFVQIGTKLYNDITSGNVAIVMSYGLAGSGKTFTLFGRDVVEDSEA